MTLDLRVMIVGCVLLIGAGVAASSGQDPQVPPPSGEGMPDGAGKDVMVRACGICHEPRRAASVRLTRDGWAAVIEGMMARGAKVSDDEFPIVLDYLTTHFLGEAAQPINVNTAPQIDLEAVAGLLRREAAAIIEYREKNGPYKTLEDLENVPGLDFSKIDSRRDFIVAM
jgi:competence protein ComEA